MTALLWAYLGGVAASLAFVAVNSESYLFAQLGWAFLGALLWPLVALGALWSAVSSVFGPLVRGCRRG